jgi:hypothetical protein
MAVLLERRIERIVSGVVDLQCRSTINPVERHAQRQIAE